MIKSMTGFGKADVLTDNKKITVEIRSLNSKQLDLSVKMPSAYREVEYEIRNIISKRLQRGKVEVYVSVESAAAESCINIDNQLFKACAEQIKTAAETAGVEVDSAAMLSAILRMPNVVSSNDRTACAEETEALLAATREAAERIDEFRIQEGASLISDILKRIDLIEKYRDEITPFEGARTTAIRNRIRENIASLGIETDHSRLEQEMIFYIEKLDITEEKVRLKNHCKYFREVAANEECAGRKLGFIAQEMGREINTTGSKANDTDIQILVVKMKDELEKIKEQVLNIL